MDRKPKEGPYIGVTGFMSRAEVVEALAVIPQESKWRLMVGVLMSSKTLAGQRNKWSGRFPKREAVADIFVYDPRVLNLVHYSTDDPDTLFVQLDAVMKLAGPNCDGLQLNVAWPASSHLEDFYEAYHDKFLVLQLGSKALLQAGTVDKFVDLVGGYTPMINAILLDPSGGLGKPFDPEKVAEYVRGIPASWISPPYGFGIGIAGGLGPSSLYLLDPLLREFIYNFSIDAEGALRTAQPEDALNISAMRTYLIDAFATLEQGG